VVLALGDSQKAVVFAGDEGNAMIMDERGDTSYAHSDGLADALERRRRWPVLLGGRGADNSE